MRLIFLLLSFYISRVFSIQFKLANSSLITNSSSSSIQQNPNLTNFQYKGVSIGGWLVLEPYITPALFNKSLESNETAKDLPVDEFHFCKKLGLEKAKELLTEHWETWYNETDFKNIKEVGLNLIRIPIGYWAFEKLEDDPYVQGQVEYLDRAIEWSKKYGLYVLIDMHGAPNTQNGFDNSGLRNIGYPGWQNNTKYIDHTYKVLNQIYLRYGTSEYNDTIIGIEVLNEPFGPSLNMNKLKEFYIETYNDARNLQQVNNTIFLQEAFQPIDYWGVFLEYGNVTITLNNTNMTKSADFENVIIDHHHYEVFAGSVTQNLSTHLENVKNYAESIGRENFGAIIGEWSAALTDCAYWVNGIGLGNRYEATKPYTDFNKTGSCKEVNQAPEHWSKEMKKDYRTFIEMQLYQYSNQSRGYIFWCWKIDQNNTEWDFQRLVKHDMVPQPLDKYKYLDKNGKVNQSSILRITTSLVVLQILIYTFIL
ncbi:unnamed protein product [Candida verbasci]|uniref:glucan 1,3-beta-glucosidase n=1 Tax=Candida verbasci TaxID=1227364 RepID=A0A9W4XHB7_9ASCO|nr:unnamed protein product [Candida verbasci]